MWLADALHQLEIDYQNYQISDTYYALADDWKAAGFTLTDAVEWTAALLVGEGLVEIELAKSFNDVGISLDEYFDWKSWGLSGFEVVAILKACEIKFAGEIGSPSVKFKRFGFDLSEAILLQEVYFSADKDDESEDGDYIGYWTKARLDVVELISLKSQFNETRSEFVEKHLSCRSQIRDWSPNFTPVLSKSLKGLKESGLPLSAQNLLRFWGLSKIQILKAIDMGADVDFARDISFASSLVRSGIPANKVKVVEHLMENGVEKNSAFELTKRHFTIGTLEKIENAGCDSDDLVEAVEKLKPLTVDKVVTWLLVDIRSSKFAWLKQIHEWHNFGFTAENAAEWYNEEFSASDANSWIKSGAKNPAVAKRRKAAGIVPNVVS